MCGRLLKITIIMLISELGDCKTFSMQNKSKSFIQLYLFYPHTQKIIKLAQFFQRQKTWKKVKKKRLNNECNISCLIDFGVI